MTHDLPKADKNLLTGYHISDLIDIDQLQSLMEKFTAATGLGTAFLDLAGNILVATGWQDICTQFHRKHPETVRRCVESDTVLSTHLKKGAEGYHIYHCLNGMVDVAMPIIIEGTHLANLFTGQFLMQEPDIDFFSQQAHKCGFDEKKYLLALAQVPVLNEEKVDVMLDYLAAFAVFLGENGLNKLRLEKLTCDLEDRVKERTLELQEVHQETLITNEKLKTMAVKLKQSNTALEQFAYVASHDLQEPLRMVSSYVQLLAERYQNQLDEKAQKFIGYAVDGAARMQQLIQDLLSFSRVNTRGAEFTQVDCNQILKLVLLNLQTIIAEKQAVITTDSLPMVFGDKGQITQLLQNLIANALKFCTASQPNIHITAQDAGDFLKISVQDNGIGIDEQYQKKVFTIFQRLHTREEYPGTGIGLALCKQIMERHKGKIHFESKVGEGTTFHITFPKY